MDVTEARAILGIGPNATLVDATRAHRRLAKLVHPDRAGGLDAEQQATATETMARLNEALDTLRSRLPEDDQANHSEPTTDNERPPASNPSPGGGRPGPQPRADSPVGRPPSQPTAPPRTSTAGGVVVAALVLLLLGGGVVYWVNHSAGAGAASATSDPTSATSAVAVDASDAPQASSAPSVNPSVTKTATPTAAKPSATPASPRSTPLLWPPRGFDTWDETLAYKWATPGTCPALSTGGCWAIDIVSRDGCRYQEYLDLEILDSAGQSVGHTYELKGRQRAGVRTRYVLPDTSFGGAGATAQISTLTCS